MKGLLGVASLLIALAIIGFVAVKQLRTVAQLPVDRSGANPTAAPGAPPAATVPEQSQRLQDKVRSDVIKALEQGARKDEPAQ